jgi:hypothetical protein
MMIGLSESPAYKKLVEMWMQDVAVIEEKRDKCAARSNESSWRYHAGLEKGFKMCMMRLQAELTEIESESGEIMEEPSAKIEKLLSEARGEKQQ